MSRFTESQVLLIEDQQGWLAQCLQFDISVHSDTLENVMYEFERAVVGHQLLAEELGIEPFKTMPAAPKKFWELWSAGTRMDLESNPAFRVSHGSSVPVPKRELRIAAGA